MASDHARRTAELIFNDFFDASEASPEFLASCYERIAVRIDAATAELRAELDEAKAVLRDARNAARYREALEQLAQWDWRTCEERDPANGPCHCSDCRTVAIARAALENRP